MAFNYTAVYAYEDMYPSGGTRTYQNNRLSFLKEVDGVWEETVVESFGSKINPLGALAQNLGSVFLIILQASATATYVYRSEDSGETWEELDTYVGRIVWFDGFGSTFVGITGAGNAIISEDYGETWSVQSALPTGPILTGVTGYGFCESNFCLDESGVLHIAIQEDYWDVYDCYYTSSADFGATWTTPVVVLTPDVSSSGLYVGGIAAMDGHVCVGGFDYLFPTQLYVMNVSHDGGETWETQTTESVPLPTGFSDSYLLRGAGVWMDTSDFYVLATLQALDAAAPYPFEDSDMWLYNGFAQSDYTASGSLVVDATGQNAAGEGAVYSYSRNTILFGGNVAYGQTGAALLSHFLTVPTDSSGDRDPPYVSYYWWTALHKHYFDSGSLLDDDIWLGSGSNGVHYSVSRWNYWRMRIDAPYMLRMSSWREAGGVSASASPSPSEPAVVIQFGPRIWMM